MSEFTSHQRYLQELVACQQPLYAWILSMVADRYLADEILQETNLTLIRRETEFIPESNFSDWAHSQAFYQVLTSRRRKQRNKLVFDDELVHMLAADAQPQAARDCDRRAALRHCLSLLAESQRSILEQRYSGLGVEEIASATGRTAGAISQALYQLRKTLKDCIQRKLTAEAVK